MHDDLGGGNDQQRTGASGTDPKVFVATTLAALVLAGSAYIWKSGTIPMLRSNGAIGGPSGKSSKKDRLAMPSDPGPSSHASGGRGVVDEDLRSSTAVGQGSPKQRRGSQFMYERDGANSGNSNQDAVGGSTQRQQEAGDAASNTLSRASRPKERRRRGKDPTKELVKSGKLNKILNTAKPKAGASSPRDHASPSPSGSRVSSESHGQSSTPRPHQRPSKSPARATSPSGHTPSHISAPLQPSRLQDKSRSRSRERASSAHEHLGPSPPRSPEVFTFDSLPTTHNPASTSSASSIAATDATASSSTSTSTAPSTSGSHHSSRHCADLDMTPRTEAEKSSDNPSPRQTGVAKDPWDWDRATQFNSPIPSTSRSPRSGSTDLPKFQPKTDVGSGSSPLSEVQSPNLPLPYASIVSSNSKSASSSCTNPEVAQAIPGLNSHDYSERRIDEVEVSFPTLNNPHSSSSSVSPYSTGTSSVSPSVSRPQSRASSSSATSSKGKSKASRAISGLTSLSTRSQTPAMSSTSLASHRRVPTPLDGLTGRPSTPSSSLASTHPPPSPSSPYHNNTGGSIGVSAQTQLASLRGALEAARLREEKSRSELEKVARDAEILRWENASFRRREGEMQAQLQQVMLQMQSYATYIASLSQLGQAVSQVPPDFQLQLPTANHAPAISPPQPADIVTVEEGEELPGEPFGSEVSPDAGNEQSSGAQSDVGYVTTPSTATVPDSDPFPRSDEGKCGQQGDTVAEETSPSKAIRSPSSPPPMRPPTTPPQTILPFAPQPLHSPLSPTFPGIAMPIHTPFLHHPGTPNTHNALNSHSPYAFPHGQLPHPQFPFMPLGLSGIGPGGHMQTLQSPIHSHPGMMMMHPGSGALSFAGPGSPTAATFRPMTPVTHGTIGSSMGIGMASGSHLHTSHPSPLWMNGMANGPIAGPSKLGSMSPASGPSSPLPPYFQIERGRKGWQKGRVSSLAGPGKLEGEQSEEGQGTKEQESLHPPEESGEGDAGDDEPEFNTLLADAILKRPSSIRMGSKRSTSNLARDSVVGLAGSISMPGMANGRPVSLVDDGQDSPRETQDGETEQEIETEFTFPSLSELGNVAREKRMGTPSLG